MHRSSTLASKLRRWVGRFKRSEDALAVTEYGMLVTFLALVLIAVIVILGGGLSNWFASKTGSITTN